MSSLTHRYSHSSGHIVTESHGLNNCTVTGIVIAKAVHINGKVAERVETYKYLGLDFNRKLNW